MEIGTIQQGVSFSPASSKAKAKAPAPKPAEAPQVEIPKNAEQARYAEVKAAAETVLANNFAVSDTRFTIFKDTSGDYITRFTSLEDGTIEYYPEKSLFDAVQAFKGSIEIPTVDTKA